MAAIAIRAALQGTTPPDDRAIQARDRVGSGNDVLYPGRAYDEGLDAHVACVLAHVARVHVLVWRGPANVDGLDVHVDPPRRRPFSVDVDVDSLDVDVASFDVLVARVHDRIARLDAHTAPLDVDASTPDLRVARLDAAPSISTPTSNHLDADVDCLDADPFDPFDPGLAPDAAPATG